MLIPNAELELLLLCSRTHIDENRRSRIVLALESQLDWHALVTLAKRHGLIPLLFRSLSGVGMWRVPADIATQLRVSSETHGFQNIVYLSVLLRLQQALADAGIVAIPYKGPALAAYLHGSVGLRQMVDIDLLVRPPDALAARRVLVAHGCVPSPQLTRLLAAARVKYHCDFTFVAGNRVSVDLNWRISPVYWRLPTIPAQAWDRLGQLSLGGGSVPWFAAEDLLLILCLHASKHRWDTLKWVVDIAELLRLNPDIRWREMLESAGRHGARRMLSVGVYLAHDLLEAPLPADVLADLQTRADVMTLVADICRNAFVDEAESVTTLMRLAFLGRAADHLGTRLACRSLGSFYFVLHHIVRPAIALVRRPTVKLGP